MSNPRLRDALLACGFTPLTLAQAVGVDPKTVERWVGAGRTPYERHRVRVANLLSEQEVYLWPSIETRRKAVETSESEVLDVYPHRSAVPRRLWRDLLHDAEREIDILVMAGLFMPEENPRFVETLRAKALAGARIRVLFSDPECAAVSLRGAEEGIGDTVRSRIRNAMAFFESLYSLVGIEIRAHETTLYNSIHRMDDRMLVNMHVYGIPGAHAPVLHLRRLGGGELFDTYLASFESVWSAATPLPLSGC